MSRGMDEVKIMETSLYDLICERKKIKRSGGDLKEIDNKISAMEQKAKSGESIRLI